MPDDLKEISIEIRKDEPYNVGNCLRTILNYLNKQEDLSVQSIITYIEGFKKSWDELHTQIYEEQAEGEMKDILFLPSLKIPYRNIGKIDWHKFILLFREKMNIIPLYGGGLDTNANFRFIITIPKSFYLGVEKKNAS